MSTLKDWILSIAGGETIESVVIGEMGWHDYGKEFVPQYDECPKGELLTWEQAEPFLSYDFDSGYGAPGCQAVYVWTATKVMYVVQYDGSTNMNYVPRHPTPGMPDMPGG
jgi:hypothetical protein